MGHEFQIDVDAVSMFGGYVWWDIGEPCDHGCRHLGQTTIGWGPTVALYELIECDGCGCRGWQDGRYSLLRHTDPPTAKFWRTVDFRRPAVGTETNDER